MILSVFTLVGVLAVSIVLFGFWIVSSIFKLIFGLVAKKSSGPASPAFGRPCMNPGCRINNPMHARFCRRCGSDLQQPIFKQNKWQPHPRYNPANGGERHAASV